MSTKWQTWLEPRGSIWPREWPNRRVSPIASRPDEGPLTEPTAAAQPSSLEPLFLPQSCHWRPIAQSLSRACVRSGQAPLDQSFSSCSSGSDPVIAINRRGDVKPERLDAERRQCDPVQPRRLPSSSAIAHMRLPIRARRKSSGRKSQPTSTSSNSDRPWSPPPTLPSCGSRTTAAAGLHKIGDRHDCGPGQRRHRSGASGAAANKSPRCVNSLTHVSRLASYWWDRSWRRLGALLQCRAPCREPIHGARACRGSSSTTARARRALGLSG
jgi:hypothetical protein